LFNEKFSLVSNFTSLTVKKIITGSTKIISKDIEIQRVLHSMKVNKKTIVSGIMNSADDNPNHEVLNALPLLFSKYRETVVEAECDIKPWPDNLIRNIAKNKNVIDEIFENKKLEIESKITT
tara:strand:+ start:593 stop:958 length:366 start_codon:yes stop_codon:yes gene_type:complete